MVTNDCIYIPRKAGVRCAYGSTMIILWGSTLRYNESALTKTITSPREVHGTKVVDKDLIWW